MSRFPYAVSFAVILLACADPVSDPTPKPVSDPTPDPTPDPSFVWANPPGCDSAAATVSLSAARHDSLPSYPSGAPLTLDEEFYRAAQHTPGGFAGMYLKPVNGRNTKVLMFVDTTEILDALDSLTAYFSGSRGSFARDSVVLRLVRWNWVQLYEWYGYFNVVGLPDWNSSDINEVTNRLEFGTKTEQGRQAILQRFNGLNASCWLAAVKIQGDVVFKSAQPPPP